MTFGNVVLKCFFSVSFKNTKKQAHNKGCRKVVMMENWPGALRFRGALEVSSL